MDNSGFPSQPGLSGRMVSFSFKVEKSQLLSPKQTDYVIVTQDGSHCGGSVKFNGVVEADPSASVSWAAAGPSVKYELAPEYASAAAGTALVKSEPQDHVTSNPLLNDSGFAEMPDQPSMFAQQEPEPTQSVVPKIEPGIGR